MCYTNPSPTTSFSQLLADKKIRAKREVLDPDSGLLIAHCCLFYALDQSSTTLFLLLLDFAYLILSRHLSVYNTLLWVF